MLCCGNNDVQEGLLVSRSPPFFCIDSHLGASSVINIFFYVWYVMFIFVVTVCRLGDIRLVNGNSSLEGRIEMCYNDAWSTICHTSWESSGAQQVCRQLNLPSTGKRVKIYISIILISLKKKKMRKQKLAKKIQTK